MRIPRPRLPKISPPRWPRPGREARLLGGQITGALAVCGGIAVWSWPSALIVGGLAVIGWCEVA